jgi:glycosyltransferase involved in cell wall biosynthesis
MCKFSIIVINCNKRKYLKDLIQSISIQTFNDWELIFIDDYSKDNSIRRFVKLIRKYSIWNKTLIIKNTQKKGYGFSLNLGCQIASGELYLILDSQNTLSNKNILKRNISRIDKHTGASLFYSDYWECNQKLKIQKGISTKNKIGKNYFKNINRLPILNYFIIIKRSAYKKLDKINLNLSKNNFQKDLILKMEKVGNLIYLPGKNYKKRTSKWR